MGNSILAHTLSFIPILEPLALAQEKPSSPVAQLWPAQASVVFGVVVSSSSIPTRAFQRAGFLCIGPVGRVDVKRDSVRLNGTERAAPSFELLVGLNTSSPCP